MGYIHGIIKVQDDVYNGERNNWGSFWLWRMALEGSNPGAAEASVRYVSVTTTPNDMASDERVVSDTQILDTCGEKKVPMAFGPAKEDAQGLFHVYSCDNRVL